MAGFSEQIIPAQFPELKGLVWNRDATRPIPAREAFALYERNWRFVDQAAMNDNEAHLVDELTREFGHGIMLG